MLDALGRRTAQRDPDGRAGEHFVPFDEIRGRERAMDALRDGDRLFVGGDAFHQQGEFVAAQPRHGVAGAAAALQAARDLDEELVAGAVPEAVVDQLEAVEVEEENGEAGGLAPLCPRERHLQPVLEQRAVRQAGERIVEGGLQQAGLRLAARGDVGRGHQQCAAALEHDFVD